MNWRSTKLASRIVNWLPLTSRGWISSSCTCGHSTTICEIRTKNSDNPSISIGTGSFCSRILPLRIARTIK
ncbi:Uncharacterised protein [Vibrio cholerae]|nr:Uncharacterised protein [Vibrio cholerae]